MNKKPSVKAAALSLLARQAYTARKMKEKLYQKGYSQQEIDEIIEWCTDAGYIDDAAWALRAAERKSAKGWSRFKISQYLRAYGVCRTDAEAAVNSTVNSGQLTVNSEDEGYEGYETDEGY